MLDSETRDAIEEYGISPIAQNILKVLWENKTSYLAGWTIADRMSIPRTSFDTSWTEYDVALKELIDKGIVEEVPNLGCRYRLVRK